MTAPAAVKIDARLVPFRDGSEHAAVHPGSWFITHGFGRPAQNTYTEVTFGPAVEADEHPPAILDAAVRQVADELYGTRWAFIYPPEAYADAVEQYGIRRRERVLVEHVEVYE